MSARVLITGATDGLGRALAARLAADGHRFVLHGRRADALDAVATELAALPGAADTPPRTVLADLARLEQVRALADTMTGDGEPLNVLVNKAGIGAGEPDGTERRITPEGYESIGQAPLDFNDVMLEHSYSGSRAYGQSKLALIAFGFILAERLPANALTVNNLHPGTPANAHPQAYDPLAREQLWALTHNLLGIPAP
ncbi:MAG: SDR family NAD(P)-dependent oxidoreductase [Solirubrobacteraceae bacterium]